MHTVSKIQTIITVAFRVYHKGVDEVGCFIDCNGKTHKMLRCSDAFPGELIKRFNNNSEVREIDLNEFLESFPEDALAILDERAFRFKEAKPIKLKGIGILRRYCPCKIFLSDKNYEEEY